MRKILLYLVAAATTLSCNNSPDGPCVSYGKGTKVTDLRAELCDGDVAIEGLSPLASADLRLKLFCEISTIEGAMYTKGSTDYDCTPRENVGLDPTLRGITLTCDRPIANIEAGEDLISVIRPRVTVKGRYDWSVEEWVSVLNNGFIPDANYPGSLIHGTVLPPDMTYEFDIELFPYFVTVTEGEYSFTLRMDFGWDTMGDDYSYTETFTGIRLK
ncbi:MAG: hypothetical protein LBV38_07390 [Alistipes sp.]|jgi:hypothetical protein|nr:hypothetical protein [Alistipes sp.]